MIPARKIVSMYAWKMSSCGTSLKSANQAAASVNVAPEFAAGRSTVTSLSVPGVSEGETVKTADWSSCAGGVTATPPIETADTPVR